LIWFSRGLIETKLVEQSRYNYYRVDADRIIVISHGSLLGEGEIHEVLKDARLLEFSGLEPPSKSLQNSFVVTKALTAAKNMIIANPARNPNEIRSSSGAVE